MKLAIMQPYLFPYIGYFQLINCVDKFIIYDDVNYIKGGWINRNKILLNGNPFMFTVPVAKASPNQLICDLSFIFSVIAEKKLLKTIDQAYRNAPEHSACMHLLQVIFAKKEKNISCFIKHSLEIIMGYLDMNTDLLVSSKLERVEARGQERIINICKLLGAAHYINLIGGIDLYNKEIFEDAGIKLSFIRSNDIIYNQGQDIFYPNLSIIDVLMFNPKTKVQSFLNEYQLI